jgi:broad specificity phosphatase PhoE
MRLYLVQHGDAVPEQLDPERPLSAAGRQDVEAVARLLAETASALSALPTAASCERNRQPSCWPRPWRLARSRRS